MKVLGPHQVTNDRLDEVSNYYRYRPQEDELWPTQEAQAYAMVECGEIKKLVVTRGGSGYSSPPKATVKGFEKVKLQTKLKFGKALNKNGSVVAVEVAPAQQK